MNIDEAIDISTTYLEQRLSDLGVSPDQNTFERVWQQDSDRLDEGRIITGCHKHRRMYKFFDADPEGNIVIRYFNLSGQPYR